MVSLKRGCICLPKLSATLNCTVFKRFHRNYTKTVDAMLNKRLTLKGNFNIEGTIFDPDGKDSMNSSVNGELTRLISVVNNSVVDNSVQVITGRCITS